MLQMRVIQLFLRFFLKLIFLILSNFFLIFLASGDSNHPKSRNFTPEEFTSNLLKSTCLIINTLPKRVNFNNNLKNQLSNLSNWISIKSIKPLLHSNSISLRPEMLRICSSQAMKDLFIYRSI